MKTGHKVTDASRTGKRLAEKTALVITAGQGIGTASVLAMVKKSPCFLVCTESALTTGQAHIIDGGCSD